jgi:hypothetical protein
MLHLRSRQSSFYRRPLFLCAVGLLFLCAPELQSQSDIHKYADAAACQMGGRAEHYIPQGIKPDPKDEIPMTWQGMKLIWDPKPPGGLDPQFMLIGDGSNPACKNGDECQIENDFPEDGVKGPFTDPTQSSVQAGKENLRCDHFSYVKPSCTPGQLVRRQIEPGKCQGGNDNGKACTANAQCSTEKCSAMRWEVLFRRTAAAANDACNAGNWGPTCTQYFDIVDAIGFKLDTYATVWLDGTTDAARDFGNGFRAGPMPRPGGKRPETRDEGKRALQWYDTPATMKAGTCNDCHGTPFNGDDWIRQPKIKRQNLNDDELPWWHAGNEEVGFPNKIFFTAAQTKDGKKSYACGSCHNRWMADAGSTPGLSSGMPLARYMTMVHEVVKNNPFTALDAADYLQLASSFRTDKPETNYFKKNAEQTHYMPLGRGGLDVIGWKMKWDASFNAVACCGSGRAGKDGKEACPPNCPKDMDLGPVAPSCVNIQCTEMVSQDEVIAGFITPWMAANNKDPVLLPKSNGPQPIAPPDAAGGVTLEFDDGEDCLDNLAPGDPNDRCFKLSWTDPNGSPYNAPASFHYAKLEAKATDPDWTDQQKKATEFCDDLPKELTVDNKAKPIFPNANESELANQQPGNKWRYGYTTYGVIEKCQKIKVRVCGGWCKELIQIAPENKPQERVSTDKGAFTATLVNDKGCD